MRNKLLIIFFLNAAFLQISFAAPTVQLSAEVRNNYRSVLFTFVQNDLPSVANCHYNLFSAPKASDLTTLPGNGLSIATFKRDVTTEQIIAGPLPRLSQLLGKTPGTFAKKVKVYFRVLVSCPGAENGLGELISVSVKTSADGRLKSVRQLMNRMKHHMQYYRNNSAAS